ncbi:MAG: hypothetical protein ACYDA8_17555 [Deferrisomatales bacterium]
MATSDDPFGRLPGDDSLAAVLRARQVPLQAELLRAGAQWEESLGLLRELSQHRRTFPSASEALAWYRRGRRSR